MAGASRIVIDSAGGIILGPGSQSVFINGLSASVLGDAVEGHGNGSHSSPNVVTASSSVFADGQGMVGETSVTSCGKSPTGSGDVFIGD
tara:strand:- start:31170 stop:31436 length:267 start_codon:yes stop_codon:yes gene_type:complete